MQLVLSNLINAVKNCLADEIKLKDALLKAKPVIDAMKPTDRTVWFHTNIAPLVAKAYRAELVLTRNGTTSFNNKDGTRHDTALSKFRYVSQLSLKKKSATSSTTSNQVDVVEKALELVESMTKAQQEKFFKRVSRK
jgi:hypothetical protein